MANIPDTKRESKDPADEAREMVEESIDRPASQSQDRGKRGPLDGSTSGTIGGGGPESGGPTARRKAPAMPPVHPEDAASGRMEPDPLSSTEPLDPLKISPTDVNRD